MKKQIVAAMLAVALMTGSAFIPASAQDMKKMDKKESKADKKASKGKSHKAMKKAAKAEKKEIKDK